MNSMYRFWAPILVIILGAGQMPFGADAMMVNHERTVPTVKIEQLMMPESIQRKMNEVYTQRRNIVHHSTVRNFATRELECLAENIYRESAGQIYEGQLAVALVTLKRRQLGAEGGFANTICGVVYQKIGAFCQFTWTCYERVSIDNQWRHDAYAYAKKIAQEALDGATLPGFDNVVNYYASYCDSGKNGCAHAPSWADQMTLVAEIGLHKFFAPGPAVVSPNFYMVQNSYE